MLLNDFFHITDQQIEGSEINALLIINAGHKIFEGHFPGQPVVPGVCMMQMIKEIIEEITLQKTNLIKAHDMKFLAVIDPVKNNAIHVNLKYSIEADNSIIVSASLFKDELVHFKFKGQFGSQ